MPEKTLHAASVLPNELWALILPFLRKPTPTLGSRPPRSDLLQIDLCRCIRVNKMFHDICEPLLYKNLVTDRLAAVLGGPDSPSKQRRLGFVETMHIEYARKSYYSTDKTIGSKADWKAGVADPFEEGTEAERKERAIRECVYELEGLTDAFAEFLNGDQNRNFFPKLRAIAVASIYGKQGRIWTRYDDLAPSNAIALIGVARYFQLFLRTIPSLEYLCLRDTTGPLGIPPTVDHGPRKTGEYLRTIHFDPDEMSEVRLPFGWPVRWIANRTKSQEWETVSQNIIEYLNDVVDFRESDETVDGLELDPKLPANLEIYASAPHVDELVDDEATNQDDNDVDGEEERGPVKVIHRSFLTVETQRELAKREGKALQAMLRDSSGVDDKVEWFASADATRCEACGKGYTGWVDEKTGKEMDNWEDSDADRGEGESDGSDDGVGWDEGGEEGE